MLEAAAAVEERAIVGIIEVMKPLLEAVVVGTPVEVDCVVAEYVEVEEA